MSFSINKETLAEGGYVYVGAMEHGEHILYNDGELEVWFPNKNHASYGLIWNNTHLEFARSASKDDIGSLSESGKRKLEKLTKEN